MKTMTLDQVLAWMEKEVARRMSKGGSHGNRETTKTLSSRAIGAAETVEAEGASGDPEGSSSKTTRKSSSIAPDYVFARKGYRSWNVRLRIYGDDEFRNNWKNASFPRKQSLVHISLRSINTPSGWAAKKVKVSQCSCHVYYSSFGLLASEAVHTCGIYSYKEAKAVTLATSGIWRRLQGSVIMDAKAVSIGFPISGSVWLWGDIIEHTHGYRAQFAYPAAFMCPEGSSPIYRRAVACVARRYGVPVVKDAEAL